MRRLQIMAEVILWVGGYCSCMYPRNTFVGMGPYREILIKVRHTAGEMEYWWDWRFASMRASFLSGWLCWKKTDVMRTCRLAIQSPVFRMGPNLMKKAHLTSEALSLFLFGFSSSSSGNRVEVFRSLIFLAAASCLCDFEHAQMSSVREHFTANEYHPATLTTACSSWYWVFHWYPSYPRGSDGNSVSKASIKAWWGTSSPAWYWRRVFFVSKYVMMSSDSQSVSRLLELLVLAFILEDRFSLRWYGGEVKTWTSSNNDVLSAIWWRSEDTRLGIQTMMCSSRFGGEVRKRVYKIKQWQ